MSATRVKVYVTPSGPDASREDVYRNTMNAYRLFEKMCKMEGVIQTYKQREFYEKPSEKRRRKAKQRLVNLKKGQNNRR